MAQNSKLGNGGSKHREGGKGHWTDHGHHALMRISAFASVGGYDETFSHNEDAEYDERVVSAGGRIYLAKDALSTGAAVRAMYPELDAWAEQAALADPDGHLQTDMTRRLELRS